MKCCIGGCIGGLLSRAVVLVLWFRGWFGDAGIDLVWIVLGFFFAPLTVICVGCVNVYNHGQWGGWQIAVLIFCLLVDFGGNGSPAARRKD